MIKSKILCGLCIAALGLPFGEAMETMPNWSDGRDKPVRSSRNKGKNFVQENKRQVRNDGRQNKPNTMRKATDSAEYRNMNGNSGLNQCVVPSYGKYDENYCGLTLASHALYMNGDLYFADKTKIGDINRNLNDKNGKENGMETEGYGTVIAQDCLNDCEIKFEMEIE